MSTNAPPDTDTAESALRPILGDGLAGGEAEFAVDGLTPRYVATPSSVDELTAALAAANEAGVAVIPWGGGCHMALGNVPSRYDVALRTTKLDGVIEYEAADLTVTVEAGMTFEQLGAILAEHGQFLPIDAPGQATIGGALAAAAGGPSQHAYGLARDWLLGCRIAQADGVLVRGGGRVVKNVAGYDLPRLIVGSLGTLGVIVEATFKLTPLPATEETLLAVHPSLGATADAILAADERGLALTAAALIDAPAAAELNTGIDIDPGAGIAAYRIAGGAAAVERTRKDLAALSVDSATLLLDGDRTASFWRRLNETLGGVELKASLPPAAVRGFVATLADGDAGAGMPLIAYPTVGVVRVALADAETDEMASIVERLRANAIAAGGSLVVTRAPVELKRRIDVWGEVDALALMRNLKQQFDPESTLNPGRFVGGI
ncbi:MAG: FAD-binding oxidoreductase [Chloroflexi bacterium]|nr:FAD-binding oxidoreductase [Chloroflexota bacterium]